MNTPCEVPIAEDPELLVLAALVAESETMVDLALALATRVEGLAAEGHLAVVGGRLDALPGTSVHGARKSEAGFLGS